MNNVEQQYLISVIKHCNNDNRNEFGNSIQSNNDLWKNQFIYSKNPINPFSQDSISNIYIVLDYDGKKPGDGMRETITFKGMESQGWHGIYAKNIQDANQQLSTYLGGRNANSILLETHGGTVEYKINGIKSKGTFFSTNNNKSRSYIRDRDLLNYKTNKDNIDIDSLLSILFKLKHNGNFYLQSCNTADSNDFFYILSDLTNNQFNLFGSTGFCGPRILLNNSDNAVYEPRLLFDRDTSLDPIKFFQADCSNNPPIILRNIQLNNKGLNLEF